MATSTPNISIIIPTYNEAHGLRQVLPELFNQYPGAEIIVVDDGSTDDSGKVCEEWNVKHIKHPYNMGNGAAVKSGARAATGSILVFMDADGQHTPDEINTMLEKLDDGYDMVVGARSRKSQASLGRLLGNSLYNKFASWIVGHNIEDLTSGFRAVRAKHFKEFLHLLPNGFSYPSTITMAFFRSGYPVNYVPINVSRRVGNSHIKPMKDFVRFLLIIFRIGTLYAPLKIFLPISVANFVMGLGYYLYTYTVSGRFTNMSALLFIASLLIFLIGLISEQITMLLYQKTNIRD